MRYCFLIATFLVLATPSLAQISKLKAKAEKGDAKAMLKLSENYLFGLGVVASQDSSDYWVNQAVATRDPDAQYLVGLQYTAMSYSSSKYAKGISLLKTAAAQNHVDALAKLSEVYRNRNTGTQSDKYYSPAKAYSYAHRAAQTGHKEALLYCAEACLSAKGTQRNDSLAVQYLQRAAGEQKFIPAQIKLADLHLQGNQALAINPFKALHRYESIIENKRSNIEQRAQAQIGIHEADKLLRKWQNLIHNAGGVLPAKTFDYHHRK